MWLACVLETDTEDLEIKVSFLHPNGPAQSFKYPSIPDILWVPTSDILDPMTARGRVYTQSHKRKVKMVQRSYRD